MIQEVAWPSGLGCRIWNLNVTGSNPPPYCYLDLFSVVPSSTTRLRCVNSQLVRLPPVGILNSLCSICNIWLFISSVPNYYTSAKYTITCILSLKTKMLNCLDRFSNITFSFCFALHRNLVRNSLLVVLLNFTQ